MKSNPLAVFMLSLATAGWLLATMTPPCHGAEPAADVDTTTVDATGTNAVTATADTPPVRRDPFWPVGYEPPKPVEVTTNEVPVVLRGQPKPEVLPDWPALKVQGITKTPEHTFFAFLEGVGMIEEGQIVRVVRQGVTFTWRVKSITESGARLERVAAQRKAPGQ